MLRTSLFCFSALLLGATALPAAAEPGEETHQVVVYIGDVDQGTEEGADVVLERIRDASATVCREERISSVANVAGTEINRCRVEATETAVQDLDNGLVTARYYGLRPEVIVSENDYGDTIIVKKPV